MKGFWSDSDGLTAVEIIAILLVICSMVCYIIYGRYDTNFADITAASIFSVAGQKVGLSFTSKRISAQQQTDNNEGGNSNV